MPGLGDLIYDDVGRPIVPGDFDFPQPQSRYPMSPDLTQTQMGQQDVPEGFAVNDAGEIFNKQTGAVLPQTQRPSVIPATRDPGGQLQLAMPKVLDIVGNMMGGVAAPVEGTALGAGLVSRGGKAKALGEVAAETVKAPAVLPASEMPAPLPWAAERYPKAGAYTVEQKTRGTEGGTYRSKAPTPEELAVTQRRDLANEEIAAGRSDPYFDLSKREYVDPNAYPYPTYEPTLGQQFSDTTGGAKALARAQEDVSGAVPKLISAYKRGEPFEGAFGFYKMKQYEQAYVDQFGEQLGREKFLKNFVEPMASTTSGNSPENNFIISQYANWMRDRGLKFPGEGQMYTVPRPASAAAMGTNNYREYLQQAMQGGGLERGGIDWMDNPKKYNFAYDFLGTGGPVMDKQMLSEVSRAQLEKPRTGGYGVWEQPAHEAAAKLNIDPRQLQEVGWAGIKKGKADIPENYTPVPMMHHINTSLWRGHRVTGLPQEDVLRGMLRGDMPVYSYAPAGQSINALFDQRN